MSEIDRRKIFAIALIIPISILPFFSGLIDQQSIPENASNCAFNQFALNFAVNETSSGALQCGNQGRIVKVNPGNVTWNTNNVTYFSSGLSLTLNKGINYTFVAYIYILVTSLGSGSASIGIQLHALTNGGKLWFVCYSTIGGTPVSAVCGVNPIPISIATITTGVPRAIGYFIYGNIRGGTNNQEKVQIDIANGGSSGSSFTLILGSFMQVNKLNY